MSNLEEIVPSLLTAWVQEDGSYRAKEGHLFLDFLEIVREKKALEKKLTLIWCGSEIFLPSNPPPAAEAKICQGKRRRPFLEVSRG